MDAEALGQLGADCETYSALLSGKLLTNSFKYQPIAP